MRPEPERGREGMPPFFGIRLWDGMEPHETRLGFCPSHRHWPEIFQLAQSPADLCATAARAAPPFSVMQNGACFRLRRNTSRGHPVRVIPAALLLRSSLSRLNRPYPVTRNRTLQLLLLRYGAKTSVFETSSGSVLQSDTFLRQIDNRRQ